MGGADCLDCYGEGCDITQCTECGEDYSDPCAHHRKGGHVAANDPYGDGVQCTCTCRTCGQSAVS